jgi:hypothetical protein
VFLCYPEIERVVGVEMVRSRYALGVAALKALSVEFPTVFVFEEAKTSATLTMKRTFDPKIPRRVVELHHGDMFAWRDLAKEAEIVICECDLPIAKKADLKDLLCSMKPSSRFLLYHSFSELPSYVEGSASGTFTLTDAAAKKHRFSPIRPGHGFTVTWGSGAHIFYLAQKLDT